MAYRQIRSKMLHMVFILKFSFAHCYSIFFFHIELFVYQGYVKRNINKMELLDTLNC